MAEPIALAALALDAAIGWPAWLYARIGHPVGLFARLITACERRWNTAARSEGRRRALGTLTMLLVLLASGGTGWLVEQAILSLAGEAGWPLIALAAWPALAQRSLHDHVRPVLDALRAFDLPAARRAVAMIVGRDTRRLDDLGVARAATESLAESFCDGVVAPLVWLVVAGLPGLWAYRAINTADSLIGHPEPPLRAFGWAAARTDDLANLVPARLAAGLLCLAGGGGWRIAWRDHARHASPNAGWPEAAMAGALGVRLAGPVSYDGEVSTKPWIGEGRSADSAALARALSIYLRACGLLWILALGVAWLV
ncbi:MAG: cobalamin biosynthesis protein CobD [Novosphingobium sp.]|nr:cobalamin biosynthesis protein CobD [Novosphingobium sp.]